MRKSLIWATGCSVLAVAFASSSAASAQDESVAASTGGISDIVVTAQRREENIQKSSLSIDVIDAADAAEVTDAKDIAALVPGVQISQGGSTMQTYVRGVGDFGSSALNQSAVSYNIDGVYVSDTTTVSTQFYDLARIEVLKGPQGTLYGRNASAGSLNLVYARPELGDASGFVMLEGGNYDYVHGSAAVNVPLGDIAAARLSGNIVRRDGYLSDGTNDDKQEAARLQVLIEPSDVFSIRLSGDVGNRHGRGGGSVLIPRQPGHGKFTGVINAIDNAARLAVSPVVYTPGAGLPPVGQTGVLEDTFIDVDQYNLSAELSYDAGFAEITFIPAYRNSDSSIGSYLSGAPFLNQEHNEQQTYELRLSREGDWGNIIVGAYYLDLDQFTAAQVFTATFITADQFANLGTESIAGFGQATINLADQFRLIAGTRYTKEDRSIDASDITNGVDFDSEVTFKEWTWRAGLEYDLTPDNMAYVTVSKGFKSGGFNIFDPTPTVTNAYEPETLYSYAVGLRNRFADNTVQFNVEGFYWDYKNSQQNALEFTPAGNLQFSTFNAASATLYGFDADLIVQPTPRDTFKAAVSYLHTKFDEFILNPPFPTDPAGNGCALNNTTPPFSIDCSGMELPRAPSWSGNASYEHVFEFANGNDLTVGASMDFSSSRRLGINYVSNELADGFVRFNADATYAFGEDQQFSFTAFTRNITNKEIPIAGNQGGLTPNLIYAQVAAPRTYGVTLRAGF